MHTLFVDSLLILFLTAYAKCDTINLDKESLLNMDKGSLFLRNAYPFWEPEVDGVKAQLGKGLVITSLIESDKVATARKMCVVDPQLLDGKTVSYSGFLTVDKTYNSNLFFWFFPTANDNPDAPLILWLQGGPGASSLFGLFLENGPFTVQRHSGKDNFTLHENPHSWHYNYSMLYVDNPVGTGFSFTDSEEGYATNLTTVAEHLHEAMKQFFVVFPELKHADFYITGESYAGKYVPALAHMIHTQNAESEEPINLKGIAVGNGFTDPTSMLSYSEYAYQLGLVDKHVRRVMRNLETKCRSAIEDGRLIEAFLGWAAVLHTVSTTARFRRLYNFLDHDQGDIDGPYASFVQSTPLRVALHVGDTEYTSLGNVYLKMLPDILNSAKPQLEEVLEAGYQVMFYSGQMDIIVAYPLSVNLYDRLNFSHAEAYNRALRKPWYLDDGQLAGYVKRAGNFVEVMVRNAGHMVPTDQPEAALQLLRTFINGEWDKVSDDPPVPIKE